MNRDFIDECLEGKRLYGDDFDILEIEKWFEGEKEEYVNLGEKSRDKYEYSYYAINDKNAFRHLPDRKFSNALGLGSAYGDELKPILRKLRKLTIVDSSDAFTVKEIDGLPVEYIKAEVDGSLPFPDDAIDLIVCFGVLHHIPNVTKVLNEFCRCLRTDGYILIRKPIISLGDWRKNRPFLTKRERGIPIDIFRRIISSAGFEVTREKKCMFPLTYKLKYFMKSPVFSSRTLLIDVIFCWLFKWNNKYHAATLLQ